eukprot:4829779-Pyramimonas_sp.AAC.1
MDPRPCEVITRWLPLAGMHTPADLVLRLRADGDGPDPLTHATLDNEHIRVLLRRLGVSARYTQTEANKMVRVLIESLGDAIVTVGAPPGDASSLPRKGSAPAPAPSWDFGDDSPVCLCCRGELSGAAE